MDSRPGRRNRAAFSNFLWCNVEGGFVMVPLLCFVLFLSFVCVFLVVTLYLTKVYVPFFSIRLLSNTSVQILLRFDSGKC